MPSSVKGANGLVTFEKWNRKVHYYLGLIFLLFLWLFSLTGLLLNHGEWGIATVANQRKETRYERTLAPLSGDSDLARAKHAADQLGLTGEIDLPATPQAPGRFDFQIARPKDASQIKLDLAVVHTQDIDPSQYFGRFLERNLLFGISYTESVQWGWLSSI